MKALNEVRTGAKVRYNDLSHGWITGVVTEVRGSLQTGGLSSGVAVSFDNGEEMAFPMPWFREAVQQGHIIVSTSSSGLGPTDRLIQAAAELKDLAGIDVFTSHGGSPASFARGPGQAPASPCPACSVPISECTCPHCGHTQWGFLAFVGIGAVIFLVCGVLGLIFTEGRDSYKDLLGAVVLLLSMLAFLVGGTGLLFAIEETKTGLRRRKDGVSRPQVARGQASIGAVVDPDGTDSPRQAPGHEVLTGACILTEAEAEGVIGKDGSDVAKVVFTNDLKTLGVDVQVSGVFECLNCGTKSKFSSSIESQAGMVGGRYKSCPGCNDQQRVGLSWRGNRLFISVSPMSGSWQPASQRSVQIETVTVRVTTQSSMSEEASPRRSNHMCVAEPCDKCGQDHCRCSTCIT